MLKTHRANRTVQRAALLVALCASACQGPNAVQGPARPAARVQEDGLAQLRADLEEFAREGAYAGSVALVWQAGRVQLLEAFGEHGLEGHAPLEIDSIFRIYSMTKAITSVAALTFVEQGRLRLDDDLSKYIPEFAQPEVALFDGAGAVKGLRPAARGIRIADLMSHTAGLTYALFDESELGRRYAAANLERRGESMLDLARRLADLPLRCDPGTAWHYSRATDVLGAVLEAIDGRSLQAILDERIFTPLGMLDTAFYVPVEKRARLAVLYTRDARRELVTLRYPIPSDPPPGCSGGGGLFSTAGDYLRFCEMLAGEGQRDGVRILSRESMELLTRDRIAGLPRQSFMHDRGFGLGVAVLTDESAGPLNGTVGSFHWSGYAGTSFFVDPECDLIGVFLVQVMADFSFMVAFREGVYASLAPAGEPSYSGSEVEE